MDSFLARLCNRLTAILAEDNYDSAFVHYYSIEFSEKLETGDEEGRPHERRCPMRGFNTYVYRCYHFGIILFMPLIKSSKYLNAAKPPEQPKGLGGWNIGYKDKPL